MFKKKKKRKRKSKKKKDIKCNEDIIYVNKQHTDVKNRI